MYLIIKACETSVYREKKHPYDCFTNLSEDKSIPMITFLVSRIQ